MPLPQNSFRALPDLFRLPLQPESTRLFGVVPSKQATGLVPTLMIDWQKAPALLSPVERRAPHTLPPPGAPIALILHCYHPQALELVLRQLPADLRLDLLLTTDTALKAAQLERCIQERANSQLRLAHLAILPNHGRDVLPFWHCLQQYHRHTTATYFIKLHLKRSPYLTKEVNPSLFDAAGWMDHLHGCLLPPSLQQANGLLAVMEAHGIGLLLPTPPLFLRPYGWGRQANLNAAMEIAEHFRVDPLFLAMPLMYPLGNMFIGKFSLFAEFASLLGDAGPYPAEPLPDDGSFLHAVERIYSALCLSRGFQVAYSLHPHVDHVPAVNSPASAAGYRLVLPVQDSGQPLTSMDLPAWLKLQAATLAVAQKEVEYLCSHPLFLIAMRIKKQWRRGFGISNPI